jgi:glutamyl-tRNA(Gln) amidotransferase subunit D
MLPETAFVKLSWLLGNYSKKEAAELLAKNLRGEITPFTRTDTYEE